MKKTDYMDLENMIWIGETVQYQEQNALLVDIDIPHVYLNIGKEEPIKVRYDEIKKINYSGTIDARNN